jgi:hypothetical protein
MNLFGVNFRLTHAWHRAGAWRRVSTLLKPYFPALETLRSPSRLFGGKEAPENGAERVARQLESATLVFA